MVCRHYWISGRVQGVFYRASTQQTAQGIGLAGWVRNLRDGRVEAVACGSEEMLAKLEAWLQQGPQMAIVEHIEIQDEPETPETVDFEVRY